MPERPDRPDRPNCLDRRCKVLDELVQDINTAGPACPHCDSPITERSSCENNEVGIKLMCDFWKILQEDPECNLSQEVQQRMCVEHCTGKCKRDQDASASKDSNCSKSIRINSPKNEPRGCRARTASKRHTCCASDSDTMPLQKVLGNLKEAASFEKKCTAKVGELAFAQKELAAQIKMLECKEKKGAELLKQADNMWSSMEDTYKKKLAASNERCQLLQNELRQIEASSNKWRKTKKDLEFSLKSADHNSDIINQRINQKTNDIKVMTLEIADFKKRIESNAKDMEATKNSYKSKKEASDARLERIAKQMVMYENKVVSECKCKADKEQEGGEYVKDAREDLQKLCRCLLQKKLENEDLRAEKEALLLEIDLLKTTCDTCTVRCAKREKNIVEETKRMDKEIEGYIAKCVQCHRFTDSSDIKNVCIDCPRCLKERDCLIKGDHCDPDHSKDCVCSRIKEKFLDNVFDNMYSVLEKESRTCPGKELADCILNCLKRSRNGKLDEGTRKILQQFILSTVKKNLNLTIVGGAVKTRCEMDAETYQQLMLCLQDVTVTPPVKEDKGTIARKAPCSRWNDTSECNCPKGPKNCPCSKRAPKPPTGPTPCGEAPQQTEEREDPSVKICPKRESLACGTDCGMLGLPGAKDHKREPCESLSCPFSNMRAAQCALGPEALASVRAQQPCPKSPPSCPTCRRNPTPPCAPCQSIVQKATCISGGKEVKTCQTDTKHLKAKIKNEEVTRTNYKKITKEKRHPKSPLSDTSPKHSILNSISSLQKDIMLGGQIQETILEELTKQDLNQYNTKKQFKLVIENGQSDCEFAELALTRSGNLAIELDDQAIKIIKEKSTGDPYLAMSIKTTSSGHVIVDLDKKESVIDNTHRVTVRRTTSGTPLLDIHKNMIKTLKDTILNQKSSLGLSKTIKLPSSPEKPETTVHTGPIDLKKNVNDKDEAGNNILQLQDVKTKNEGLKHTFSKTTPNSDSCKLMSGTDLKGTTSTTHIDSDLKSVTEPTIADIYMEDILSPIITELLNHDRMKNLKSVCTETTINSERSKVTSCTDCADLIIRDIKENTIIDKHALLKNEEKEGPSCSYAKTNTSSVSCKLITELDSPRDWLTISSWKSCTTQSVDDSNYRSEFKKLYNKGYGNVALDIQVENGLVWKLSTVVRKTKSGTIAIYAKDMSSFNEISSDGKEYPVLLTKTISGTYFVSISNNDQNFNAALKKTPSEGILLIPKLFQEKKRKEKNVKDFFKVKLSIMRNQSLELPAVLKTTSSDNYLVVLDKEFESHYKAIINKYFENKLEGSIDLHTTSSGNFIIELDNEDESRVVKKNALLVKSLSGNIKVLVQRPEFESMAQLESTSSSTSLAQPSAQMNANLPASSREFHRENLRKSKNLGNSKASSAIRLFEKVKVTLQDSALLNTERSAVLKKTASGQYAVVLNKESKKTFLDNIQSNNPEGLVAIKRLDSREIIVDLENKDVEKGLYGTLKITPSGNIYVVVDEEAVTALAESSITDEQLCSTATTRPEHVTQLIDSVISSIPTSYRAKPECCCCDTPTCVCNDSQFDTMDGSSYKLGKQFSPCISKEADTSKYNTEKCGVAPELGTSKDVLPLIVIKPILNSNAPKNDFNPTEQCYFLLSSGCTSHQFTYDGISSELSEIPELSKAHGRRSTKKIAFADDYEQRAGQNARQIWDTFCNLLPPQLPAFLKDIVHRSDAQ